MGETLVFAVLMMAFIGTLIFFAAYLSNEGATTMANQHASTINDLVMNRQKQQPEISAAAAAEAVPSAKAMAKPQTGSNGVAPQSPWFLMATNGGGDEFTDLIRNQGWRGVILETLPENYVGLNEELKDAWPKVAVENAKLCRNPGMVALSEDELMSTLGYLGKNVLDAVAGKRGRKDQQKPPPIMVPCTTLKSVIEKYRPSVWEYLKVPYENCDLLDFVSFELKPSFVDLTGTFLLPEKCERSLNSQGYHFVRQNGLSIILEHTSAQK